MKRRHSDIQEAVLRLLPHEMEPEQVLESVMRLHVNRLMQCMDTAQLELMILEATRVVAPEFAEALPQ